MVRKYNKGARAERELCKKLDKLGFAVIRAAGSGGSISTPDIVGIKKGRVLAFECKAWKTTPRLGKKEYENFKEWCLMSGALGFLAWKNKGWKFLGLKDIPNTSIKKSGLSFKDLMFVINV